MKNVLFLAFWYPNKYNRQFCVYMQEHARAIYTSGNSIKVLALHFKDSHLLYRNYLEIEKDEFGFEVYHVYIESWLYRWIHINPWHVNAIVHKYFKLIYPKQKPDLIHANIVGVCAISGNHLAQKYGLKLVITEHWTRVNHYMRNNKLSFLGRRAYDHASTITVVSDYLRKTVSNYVKVPSKIHLIPNIVDPQTFAFKNKLQKESELVFCSIGHLRAPKLPILMVEALDVFAQQSNKNILFYMYGEGPLKKQLQQRIPSLHYTLVLKGLRPKAEIAETLSASDFFLHGSSIETFCIAIAEALCTGTPVLASNNTAIPELVDAGSGILTEDTLSAWVEALHLLVQKKWDHQYISEKVRTKFTYQTVGSQFAKLYTAIA